MDGLLIGKASLFVGSFLLGFAAQPDTHSITLRDAIEVVADYEVRHPEVPNSTAWYGWTDIELRQIFTIENADLRQRRTTIIHEITHVSRRLNGETLPSHDEEEEIVKGLTEKTYAELFTNR